jgi:hypothetical protein
MQEASILAVNLLKGSEKFVMNQNSANILRKKYSLMGIFKFNNG